MSTKGKQGFAAMTGKQRRAISSLGGKAVHQQGKAHQWTSEEAREAGKIGGKWSKSKIPRFKEEL